MTYTEFAVLEDEELLAFTLTQANASNLEIELAQRLSVLVDMVDELQEQLAVMTGIEAVEEVELVGSRLRGPYEQDPRGKSKRLC